MQTGVRVVTMTVLAAVCFGTSVGAATYDAASCSSGDVTAAIALADHGDTVTIPAGSCTWSSSVSTSSKNLTLQGAGVGMTTITWTSSGWAITHNATVDDAGSFRLSGVSFDCNRNGGALYVTNGAHDLRVDHNQFFECRYDQNTTSGVVTIKDVENGDHSWGVIDHNQWLECGGYHVEIYGDGRGGWARGLTLGTADNIFVEDNTIINHVNPQRHAIASNNGSHYVYRYNSIDIGDELGLAVIDAHGYCIYQAGSYSVEIYGNSIENDDGWAGIAIRGGGGVIFDNVFTDSTGGGDGLTQLPVFLRNYRSWQECLQGGLCEDNEGYPCVDQIGDEDNDLYIWGNTIDWIAEMVTVDTTGDTTTHVQEGRDYHLIPKPGYQPYTYPHPLTGIIFEDDFESGAISAWSTSVP